MWILVNLPPWSVQLIIQGPNLTDWRLKGAILLVKRVCFGWTDSPRTLLLPVILVGIHSKRFTVKVVSSSSRSFGLIHRWMSVFSAFLKEMDVPKGFDFSSKAGNDLQWLPFTVAQSPFPGLSLKTIFGQNVKSLCKVQRKRSTSSIRHLVLVDIFRVFLYQFMKEFCDPHGVWVCWNFLRYRIIPCSQWDVKPWSKFSQILDSWNVPCKFGIFSPNIHTCSWWFFNMFSTQLMDRFSEFPPPTLQLTGKPGEFGNTYLDVSLWWCKWCGDGAQPVRLGGIKDPACVCMCFVLDDSGVFLEDILLFYLTKKTLLGFLDKDAPPPLPRPHPPCSLFLLLRLVLLPLSRARSCYYEWYYNHHHCYCYRYCSYHPCLVFPCLFGQVGISRSKVFYYILEGKILRS